MRSSTLKGFLCVALGLVSTLAISQRAEEPDYRYDIGGKIHNMTLTQGGTLVLATNDGLVGVKPGKEELLFNFKDYGRVKPEEITFIPNAPYLVVGQTGFGAMTTKKAVIDYMSGETLFSTEKNGWKIIMTCDVMMPQNKLVVSGQRRANEDYAMAMATYDLATGEREHYFTFKGSETVSGRPLLLSDGLLVPTSKALKKVNLENGEIEWSIKVDDLKWMVADATEKEIYGMEVAANGGNTRIHKIGSNGTLLWEEPYKVKGTVVNFEILPQGLAIVSNVDNSGKSGLGKLTSGRSESKIAFLSASNGEDLWEKAPKTKGYVQHFYIMDDGILFGIYEGGINKISFDGNTLFKKPLKTGEDILTMAQTPQGLIYITAEDANIVNLETGDQVWEKPLKYKRAEAVSSTFDEKNQRYIICADEDIYAVDASTGAVSGLAEVKLEGKEVPTSIEIRNGGLLLSSDQNMLHMDKNGETVWHEYYRAPGKSAAGAILMGVLAVASAATSAAAYNAANQHRNRLGYYTDRGEAYADLGDGMAVAASASIGEMLKRFKATAATENARFILTKLEDGVGLVKINKDNGKVEKEIVLKDKKPEYEVDERGGMLYYMADNNSLYAYDLKK
jgi:hypothetical protein